MTAGKADVVVRGGPVFQSLEAGCCEALAIRAGRVVAGGSAAEVAPLVGPSTRVVELEGRAAVPGFNDAHQHLLSLGMAMTQVNLRPGVVRTLDDVLRTLSAHAAATPPGEWIFGGRYDHFQLDVKRHPTREELDAAVPGHPVYIKRTDGHMGVANSLALERAGVGEDAPDPPGGHLERRDGRLTGLLQERAQELVLSAIPPAPRDRLVDAIERAGRHMLSRGVTSVMDAAVGGVQGFEDYLAYRDAERDGRLPVRCYMALYGAANGVLERAVEDGILTGTGDERLKVGPAKIFTDGSAGGRTAALSRPYVGGEDNDRGIFLYDDAELHEVAERYHRAGFQLAIHAIGDAAIEQTLRVYERVLDAFPGGERRHRIEHCGCITPAQIATMKRRGIYPAPQPVFVYDFGDLYLEVLGEQRAATCYPMGTWMREGLCPAASSDAPVCDTDVMTNLYAMVTRKTSSGVVLGAGERLTLAQAVSACTRNGAFLSFSEDVKGTLAPGQLADIAVIDRDIFSTQPEALREAAVDMTLVEGEIVYGSLA